MQTPINSRDLSLQSTAPRVLPISTNYINLTCPTQQFKYGTDNVAQPVSTVVTATLIGILKGTVTFSTTGLDPVPVANGNTLTINPEHMTGDIVTINASMVAQGTTYQAVPVTISKIFNQLVAKTTRTIDLLPAYTDGTGYTLPAADNYIELYNGVSKLTTGVVYSPATQTKNGVTATVNTATGLITISEPAANAWTSNSESFTFTATRNLIAYTTAYTITKAKQGTGGAQLAEIALYQWSTVQPAAPTGTSTYTWLTKAHVYAGTDSWKETVQTSPGGTNIKLWQVTVGIVAQSSLSTTTYVVGSTSWAGGTIRQIRTESNALIKTYSAKIYRNSIGSPNPPAGTTTYTWLTNNIAAAPTNWNTDPPAVQTGYTLYEAAVDLVAAQADTVSTIDWTLSNITPVRYYGTDGASARRAYALVTSSSTPNASLASYTATGDSLPAAGTWFTGITWTTAAPTTIAENQTLYQSDGVFVTNGDTSWGFPYISSLKVGNLAAITVNTGGLKVTDYIKGGDASSLTTGNGFYVDSNGYLRVGSATGSQLRFDADGLAITDSSGNSIFTVVSNANTNATTALQTAGSVTWLGDVAIQIVTGTQLKKTGGSTGTWDSQRYSAESYVNGAYITFIPVATAYSFMIGLDASPTTNSSYSSIDYAWYCEAGGSLYIYENGTGASFDVGIPAQTYNTSTVLGIVYDGKTVKYYKDGIVIRTLNEVANKRLYADSSFATINAEAKSIRFGPVGAAGVDGITPTLSIGTVSTGAAGSSASVSPTTSGTNTTLNFTIPRGDQGITGTSYWLVTNVAAINKSSSGSFSPPYVNGTIKKNDGTTITDFAGYFKIYNNGVLVYTSTSAETSKLYNFTSVANTSGVEIIAYSDSGLTKLIGSLFVPVVTDGANSIVPGPTGTRGSKWAYINATSFVQSTVDNYFLSTYGSKVTGDIVTVYNNPTKFSETWTWDGSNWNKITVTIDGNLLVTGSVTSDKIQVNTLSAIKSDLGTITAGDLSIGTSPTITSSGTNMTGTGSHLYSNGNFVFGNPTTNIVFDTNKGITLNGFSEQSSGQVVNGPEIPQGSTGKSAPLFTFTISKTAQCLLGAAGTIYLESRNTSVYSFNADFSIKIGRIVLASEIVQGVRYRIRTSGNTPFTSWGASSNADGTVFIAGASNLPGDGTVYVYDEISNSFWTQQKTVNISGLATGGTFGGITYRAISGQFNYTQTRKLEPNLGGYDLVIEPGLVIAFNSSGTILQQNVVPNVAPAWFVQTCLHTSTFVFAARI